MTVIILALVLFLALPLAVLFTVKSEKRLIKQDAVIERQSRRISNLEQQVLKAQDERKTIP